MLSLLQLEFRHCERERTRPGKTRIPEPRGRDPLATAGHSPVDDDVTARAGYWRNTKRASSDGCSVCSYPLCSQGHESDKGRASLPQPYPQTLAIYPRLERVA